MTNEELMNRLRYVFDDTDEVLGWIDTSTYEGAETHTHIFGMWSTMLEAADRIEQLEAALRKIEQVGSAVENIALWQAQKIARAALGEKKDG
jgi:hypothetical protein